MANKSLISELFIDLRIGTDFLRSELKKVNSDLKRTGRDWKRIGSDMTRSFTVPLAGIGVGALAAAVQVDNAYKIIRKGAGATGKDLELLKKDFREVFRNVPDSAEKVGTAIAGIKSRTGLAGEALQQLSKQTLDLARLTDSDLNTVIDTSTRAFGDWSISMDDANKAMDFMFKASQETGTELTRLQRLIVQYGAPLRQFGFGFQEATTLISKFEKEGVNTEIVFSGLRQAMVRLSKTGEPLRDSLLSVFKELKRLDGAGAIDLAQKVFGAKTGADFAAAVREGRFEIDELLTKLQQSPETIARAAREAKTFTQELQQLGNNATLAIEPLGSQIIKEVKPAFEVILGIINALGESFRSLSPITKQFVVIFGGLLAIAGPLALGLAAVKFALAALITVPGFVIISFVALGGALVAFKDEIIEVFEKAKTAIEDFKRFFHIRALAIKKTFENIWENPLDHGGMRRAIDEVTAEMKKLEQQSGSTSGNQVELNKELGEGKGVIDSVKDAVAELSDKLKNKVLSATRARDIMGKLTKQLGGAGSEVEKLTKEWSKMLQQFNSTEVESDLKKGIQRSLENLDQSAFENFTSKLRAAIEDRVFRDIGERFGEAIPQNQIKEYARKSADALVEPYTESWDKAVEQGQEKLLDEQKKTYQEGIDFWRSTFENAITGTTFSLKDALKQVAVGFASEIANAVVGVPAGLKSPQDLGGFVAQSITGGGQAGNGLLGNILGTSGLGKGGLLGNLLGGGSSGGAGVLLSDGSVVSASAAIPEGLSAVGSAPVSGAGLGSVISGAATAAIPFAAAFAAEQAISSIPNIGKSTNESLVGLTDIIAPGLGKVTEKVLGAFGVGSGPSHPETLARMGVFDKLNEHLDKIGGLSFLQSTDGQRQAVNVSNLDPNAGGDIESRFNDLGTADSFIGKFGQEVALQFSSVGEALTTLLGVTEDVGGQIGIILAENFGGSVDAIRGLVNSMNISVQDLEQVWVDAGLEGSRSWHEVEVALQKVHEAVGPGLKGIGDMVGAFKLLLNSGGRGAISLERLKNVATEAIEAGAESFDILKASLRESGEFTATEIQSIFHGLAERGIKDFESLLGASDRVLGGVIADMQSFGVEWKNAAEEIQLVKDNIEALPEVIETRVVVNADIDPQLEKIINSTNGGGSLTAGLSGGGVAVEGFAKGGIFRQASFLGMNALSGAATFAGEKGDEAIFPIVKSGGIMGISDFSNGRKKGGNINIFVDASGAAPGMEFLIEERMRDAMEEMRDGVISQIESHSDRGGF